MADDAENTDERSISVTAKGDRADNFRRIIVHPHLRDTVDAMRRVGVRLPPDATMVQPISDNSSTGAKISLIESDRAIAIDARNGRAVLDEGVPIFAYDESIAKYAALEGTAQFTAHALVTASNAQYLPVVFVSAYFYTRSKDIGLRQPALRYSDDPNVQAQKDCVKDQIDLLRENVPPGSILLIDGPLIAGDVYTTFIPFISELHDLDIIPVFVVKNSESSLVLDAVPAWRDKYNSDLHWAHRTLDRGERSALFKYQDLHNRKNSKVFTYVRAVENSPLRFELHTDTFERYHDRIKGILDLCYYLVLAQGSPANPQPRPIAVAEMYAREAIKVLDVRSLMRRAHLVPTMNEVRFGSP